MQKIVLIVGASGAGKDTLLRNIKDKIEANFITRYITRAPDKNEENFYIDQDAFKVLKDAGFFVSTWEAHTNYYGIAKNQIKEGLNIISVSRSSIRDFERAFKDVTTISISVSSKILYRRLKDRGRESEEEILKRLNRKYDKIDSSNLIEFINDKALDESTAEFVKLLTDVTHPM